MVSKPRMYVFRLFTPCRELSRSKRSPLYKIRWNFVSKIVALTSSIRIISNCCLLQRFLYLLANRFDSHHNLCNNENTWTSNQLQQHNAYLTSPESIQIIGYFAPGQGKQKHFLSISKDDSLNTLAVLRIGTTWNIHCRILKDDAHPGIGLYRHASWPPTSLQDKPMTHPRTVRGRPGQDVPRPLRTGRRPV